MDKIQRKWNHNRSTTFAITTRLSNWQLQFFGFFFGSLFKSKEEFAKTVPGLALFMVPYEHKIRSSSPSPAACVQRTHSYQSGHHEEGLWGAEEAVGVGYFNLKESFSTALSTLCWRVQENPICLSIPVSTRRSDKSDFVLTWWSGESMSPVPLAGPEHSSLKNRWGVGGERERSLQGLCCVFAVRVEAFCMVDAVFRLSPSMPRICKKKKHYLQTKGFKNQNW